MIHIKKWIIGIFAVIGTFTVLACGALIFVWYIFKLPPTWEDLAFKRSFNSIQIGSTERDVIKLLGTSENSGKQFYLSQPAGYEQEYADAAKSSSVRYLFWHREIDLTYAIGFDKNAKVSYKAWGGT